MSIDHTEAFRRQAAKKLNDVEGSREYLEKQPGKIWSTTELAKEFEVIGFMAPFVVVKNLETGERGSLFFQDIPRYYFNFRSDNRPNPFIRFI